MRRRSRAGGSPSKSRGRRVVAPKRRAAPKAPGLRHSAAANQETKAARLARERDEALEQLSAASEILKVISSSPGDLSSVFDAILENATRICEAKFGVLFLFDGEGFRFAADVSTSPELANFLRQRGSFQPTSGGPLERVMQTKGPSHTNDHAAEAPSARLSRSKGAGRTPRPGSTPRARFSRACFRSCPSPSPAAGHNRTGRGTTVYYQMRGTNHD